MRAFALLLLAAAVPALADDAGILRCRAIKDSAARLACYDALQVPSVPPAAAPAASVSPPPAASVSSAPAAKAAPAKSPEQFGFEERAAAATQLDAIESTIPGRFDGWGPNDVIRFANGQAWQIVDDSKGALWKENPKVRVRRGLLGAFYLEIEGTNRSPRVKRVK